MRRSLLFKMTLAFVLVAVISASVIMIFLRATSLDRFNRFIMDQVSSNVRDSLESYYSLNASWEGVGDYWITVRTQLAGPEGAPPPQLDQAEVRKPDDRRNFFALVDLEGVVVLPAEPDYPLGLKVSDAVLQNGSTIKVKYNNETVGYMIAPPRKPQLTAEENAFLERSNRALLESTLIAVAIAAVIAILLSATLVRPLRQLTRAAQNMAAGDLEQQVAVQSKDEIGQLAEAFNQMSREIARVNKLRRQMTADIAHDLRTPITVISGYIESMRDGVLKPTPERLGMIYAEIERLEALVNDLRLLSQVDAGELPIHPQSLDPKTLLERAAATFQHRAELQQIALKVEAQANLPDLALDEARMMQVLSNLIANALQFTPAGGVITLRAEREDNRVCLSVSDTGQGIPAEELERVFDRFYRVDSARQDSAGGSGLGLAIVKALVEAQGGKVSVASQMDKGTVFRIDFRV